MERRPIKDHHESIRLKKRQTNDFRVSLYSSSLCVCSWGDLLHVTLIFFLYLKASKRGREEFLQEDYAIKTSSQELPQWSRQMKV